MRSYPSLPPHSQRNSSRGMVRAWEARVLIVHPISGDSPLHGKARRSSMLMLFDVHDGTLLPSSSAARSSITASHTMPGSKASLLFLLWLSSSMRRWLSHPSDIVASVVAGTFR
eukprot:CAMPEP_0198111502 /NCGR_PEP_ID=MMETSP1442-20131203/3478_1 /TAXON_ID= /ORGANISM="Craspedostauros australis, Strain CCMP3328" /LENGTH=113 /DNA_ID=CAMNT_0043767973 /DNA_START=442 /DNA_END=781 /DNA_ORIENTATION=-